MTKEIGQFAVRYSEDLKHVIIAYISIDSSALSTHVALFNRLKGIVKPTGQYSSLAFKDNTFLGMHFENTVTEECLMQALSQ